MNKNYIIRHERQTEYHQVENLVREAFWNVYRPGCLEHHVLHCLRGDSAFIPELDFVMEVDGRLIGQCIYMHATIQADDGQSIPIVTMGPIGIHPDYTRQGYGKALLDYSLAKAVEMGFGAICFEGKDKGICTEALRMVIDYCFNEKGFTTLWGSYFPSNPASGRVMEKCGFVDTGEETLCPNLEVGSVRPVRVMKLKKSALYSEMLSHADPAQVAGLSRFFKTGPGQYGEGDKFLGIKVPVTRGVVKALWRQTSFEELEACIANEYHEVRLAALLALIELFRHCHSERERRICIDFYLSHTSQINNWDLVDLSCYPLLGEWLLDKDRTLLYDLARSGKTIWEQRIGIVSTMTLIRHRQLDDTFAIADILLHHPHDLIHKAVGWLLREAGKRDKVALETFLRPRYRTMPRTMLRYAIEKFPQEERAVYIGRCS